MKIKKPLTIERILAWADAHHARMGRWPTQWSGQIRDTRRENWANVNDMLRRGGRGLPGGSSLSRLLAERRGRPPGGPKRSKLSIRQILAWADEHHRRTGRWPSSTLGTIAGSNGEKWLNIQQALYFGTRGLRGGSSLAQLLLKQRGASAKGRRRPPLTIRRILAWADAHRRRSRRWPNARSGPIAESAGETWSSVDYALRHGRGRLRGGSRLSQLLVERRRAQILGYRRGPLTRRQILEWIERHHRRTGIWPNAGSGHIVDEPGETWGAVNAALSEGRRGLPGGETLLTLRNERWNVGRDGRPQFHHAGILAWADAHHRRTGRWPRSSSGAIHEAPAENWRHVDAALRRGLRGLNRSGSLRKFLHKHRDVPLHAPYKLLTVARILAWADAHYRRTGEWPRGSSGAIQEAPAEDWRLVDSALHGGFRGLHRSGSLRKFLHQQRGAPLRRPYKPLTVARILAWADAHFRRTGEWPERASGAVCGAPGETWQKLDVALRGGGRGLRGRRSLEKLLARHRGAKS
ncbi:MAG TPA: hypothetical protein VGX78_04745 [Pirellulales bacterium]|jgi:hypothetical protein|nr:hypothetical protein [Pirellulales bacterium]